MQVKADMMEKLSRTLQTERNDLKEKLKVYEPQPTINESSTTEIASDRAIAEKEATNEETTKKTDEEVEQEELQKEVTASN